MTSKTTVEAKDLRFPVVVFDEDCGEAAIVCKNQKELTHELNCWDYEYGNPTIAEVRRDLVCETVVKKVVKEEKSHKLVKKARS